MRHTIYIILCILLLCTVSDAMAKDFTVVIDPGHGGKDAGALGLRTNEKSINLNVALKLKEMLEKEMDDTKVEMTRSTDRFVALQKRADFANNKHADIFISIHANSISSKSPMHRKINGASVYTLGLDRSDTNLSVAMRENEVIKLESDYSTTYQGFDPSSTESYIAFEMMQHKNMDQSIALAEAVQNQLVRTAGRKNNGVRQAPFWVLVRTSMPSILVELDFICNPAMEKFMASEDGSDKLARAIYHGIERYRNSSGASSKKFPAHKHAKKHQTQEAVSEPASASGEKHEATTDVNNTSEIIYKIQFLTSPTQLKKNDKKLKDIKDFDSYRDGNSVKYTYGSYPSVKAAASDLKKIKVKFPDAFVIKTRDGKRIK